MPLLLNQIWVYFLARETCLFLKILDYEKFSYTFYFSTSIKHAFGEIL